MNTKKRTEKFKLIFKTGFVGTRVSQLYFDRIIVKLVCFSLIIKSDKTSPCSTLPE